MILYQGRILDNINQKACISTLKNDCYETIDSGKTIQVTEVIEACDTLAKKVRNHEFDDIILPLLQSLDIPLSHFEDYISMFERNALESKVVTELGSNYDFLPDIEGSKRRIMPLGILFHIAAGNVDALPAYSVVEGLLAGNINILKLPSGDNGLSIKLLHELIKVMPKLQNYIYVFDVPSTEIETLKIFADIADGIVVWGSDAAVSAARKLASVDTKIIAWGHKLSFAYATNNATDEDLIGLAHHICETNQLLCSSSQGIFLDTNNRQDLDAFGKRFADIFFEVNLTHKPVSIGIRGKNTIAIYNERLEQFHTAKTVYSKNGVSVIVSEDSNLELSMLFRNVWIKPLLRSDIVKIIKPHKNHLQTVGLMCSAREKEELSNRLLKSGIIRVTKARDMSRFYIGETHDGTYALREYTRVVETI